MNRALGHFCALNWLNWARRTSWGWWDDWDDTVLQTQDSKFEPWRSEAEHATSRSRRLPTILTFTRGWGRNIFVSLKPPRPGTEPRTLAWKAVVLTTTLGPPPNRECTVKSNKVYPRTGWNGISRKTKESEVTNTSLQKTKRWHDWNLQITPRKIWPPTAASTGSARQVRHSQY